MKILAAKGMPIVDQYIYETLEINVERDGLEDERIYPIISPSDLSSVLSDARH